MILVYSRSFLCCFVFPLYEETGQAWEYHYQFKFNKKYIKMHEFISIFLNPLPSDIMYWIPWLQLLCFGCQENVFNWIWQGGHGFYIPEYHGCTFTFVKMNHNPCFETTSANQPGWTVTHCRQCLMTYHLHSLGPALEVESHQFWGWYVEDWPAASWMRCCYYPF